MNPFRRIRRGNASRAGKTISESNAANSKCPELLAKKISHQPFP